MQRIFHTPDGYRDIYKKEYKEKKTLTAKVDQVFAEFGYEAIQTPAVEFFEVFSREVGTTPSRELYKFFDKEGNTMVLRPDFTPSIARAAATYFLGKEEPLRLCYSGNTFINHSGLRGRLRENTQMGVEYLGDGSAEADAEVLAMAVECLKQAGLAEFQISVGEIEFFRALLTEAGMDEDTEEKLRALISKKNYFGVEELVRELDLNQELTEVFLCLPQLFGSVEILEEAQRLTSNQRALAAISRLREIYEILKYYGVEKYISFDLGMLSKFRYYTGIIFQGYTYGTGEPIVKGGRYDTLLQHFGKPAPAVGFGIVIDQLHLALNRQRIEIPTAEEPMVLEYDDNTREAVISEAVSLRSQGKRVLLQRKKEDVPCGI